MKFSEIRDRVCEDMEDDGGAAVFNGMTHLEWLHRERGDHAGWASYVDDLRQGREWPGALEIHRVARILNINVEVYTAEGMEFKRIMNMNAGALIKARLEYQNGCHYEPLIDRECRQPLGAVKSDPHVNIVETLKEDERLNFTILLANVSSFNKHRDVVYHYAEERAADCILATETRLRTDIKLAKMKSAESGFSMLCGKPRPMKENSAAPREGGTAILARTWTAVDASLHRPAAHRLDDSYASHTVVPLGAKKLLHILVCYCQQGNREQVRHLLDYAISLGPVPVVIGCDWNATADEILPLAPGWYDPAEHLSEHNAELKHELETATTIRHEGVVARRVDFYLVNSHALPFVRRATTLIQQPLANHFPVELVLSLPTVDVKVPTVIKTRDYRAASPDEVKVAWEQLADTYADQFRSATDRLDTEDMWNTWSAWAEAALEAAIPATDDLTLERVVAPKGTSPKIAMSNALAPASRRGAVDRKARHLSKLYSWCRRMQVLRQKADKTEVEFAEIATVMKKLAHSIDNVLDVADQPAVDDFDGILQAVMQAKETHYRDVAAQRIATWRHRVGGSVVAACKWLRGERQTLTSIVEDSGSLLVHPTEIANEVRERCRRAFETPPDKQKRDEFMAKYGNLLDTVECDLPALDGKRLRKALSKPDSSAGCDGWNGHELLVLPEAAWELLANVFSTIEKTQRWPQALASAFAAAIPKQGHPGKLRLLGITSIVYRAWARTRILDMADWTKQWAGDELHGGMKGRSTTTASLKIALELSQAIIDDEGYCGTSLDYTACFDRVDVNLCVELLIQLGMPSCLALTIQAFYANLQKIVKVGSTIAPPFASPAGILQGCPFSALMLAAVMATWVRHAKAQLEDGEALSLSVYVDDRHLAAPDPATVAKVLAATVEFDRLANGSLNEAKTQIYGTKKVDMTPLTDQMPEATRVDRVWSLGFALPTGADPDSINIDKVQARVDKAIAVAEKARHLPHDVRVRALECTFPAMLEYGIEFLPHTVANMKRLKSAIHSSIWGTRRNAASPQILWTLLYKGHRLLPAYRQIQRSVRFLYDMIQYNSAQQQDVLADLHAKVARNRSRSAQTPLHVVQTECAALGWEWNSWHSLRVRTSSATFKIVDLREKEWQRHAHFLREGIRFNIWSRGKSPNLRFDMQGIEDILDYEKTRAAMDPNMTFLQKGTLRTVLTGAVFTPARRVAATKLTPFQAICPHCAEGVVETLGHAAWACSGRREVRARLGLDDFPHDVHPRCTTRCGLAVVGSPLTTDTVRSIHHLLVHVAAQSPCKPPPSLTS